MAVRGEIYVEGSTVVFSCEESYIGSDPDELRETLESKIDLEIIPDESCIGTVTFPTVSDNNSKTSFTIHDEYKQYTALF